MMIANSKPKQNPKKFGQKCRCGLMMIPLIVAFTLTSLQSTLIKLTGMNDSDPINQAFIMAGDGDTILVEGGHYFVRDLQITKKIVLKGLNNPVLDGNHVNAILHVLADSVNISGFVFQNTGVSFIEDKAAIKLSGVKNVVLENNILLNNFFGIYLAESEDCVIRNNLIESHSTRQTSAGNGIHLWYCKKITITGNQVRGHRDGIYFEFVEDGHVEGNLSEENLRYGLHFMFSNNCRYLKNTFRHNGAGVAVMYTKNVLMQANQFEYNWGPASFGLLLKEINDSVILDNRFFNNSTGLYTESSNRVQIERNVFENNGWAIKLMANSMDNFFRGNDFINNSFAVATNSRQNFNTFDGNYWHGYRGYDLDRDGTGDIPYRPVGLFSLIVEKQHPALVLLKSFFISLLEVSESIFPVLTPETLADNHPRMRRNH
jgi:nitrous oxidase accessory protein